jgi:hypothetical protein
LDRLDDPTTEAALAVTPMAEAARVIRDAAADRGRRLRTPDPRTPVRALDVLLDELERFNLAGGALTSSPAVMDWLGQVQSGVRLPIPGWVLSVPDTVRLHAAMLRWQGVLLSACHPERDGMGDVHDEPLDLLLLSHGAPALLPGRPRIRRQVA